LRFTPLSRRLPWYGPAVWAVRELLRELHQSGYVHGGIRSVNIFVGDSEEDFRLLDFNWAGPIGEARY
jgi:RIO-like serine/threonine protein kinase